MVAARISEMICGFFRFLSLLIHRLILALGMWCHLRIPVSIMTFFDLPKKSNSAINMRAERYFHGTGCRGRGRGVQYWTNGRTDGRTDLRFLSGFFFTVVARFVIVGRKAGPCHPTLVCESGAPGRRVGIYWHRRSDTYTYVYYYIHYILGERCGELCRGAIYNLGNKSVIRPLYEWHKTPRGPFALSTPN